MYRVQTMEGAPDDDCVVGLAGWLIEPAGDHTDAAVRQMLFVALAFMPRGFNSVRFINGLPALSRLNRDGAAWTIHLPSPSGPSTVTLDRRAKSVPAGPVKPGGKGWGDGSCRTFRELSA